jgi:hypothetical protein
MACNCLRRTRPILLLAAATTRFFRDGPLAHPKQLAQRMNTDAPGGSLLEELDHRQNELLDALELLNARIEQVISETLSWRGSEATA